MNYYIVSEEELERLKNEAFACGAALVGYGMGDMLNAEAACRARPVEKEYGPFIATKDSLWREVEK